MRKHPHFHVSFFADSEVTVKNAYKSEMALVELFAEYLGYEVENDNGTKGHKDFTIYGMLASEANFLLDAILLVAGVYGVNATSTGFVMTDGKQPRVFPNEEFSLWKPEEAENVEKVAG